MSVLKIVIASVREGRAADRVIPWVVSSATNHGAFDVEVLDLRDWVLPIFAETAATIGDPSSPTYSAPIVREWNKKFKEADAFLFVTPEYNHGIPGGLKNALDSVFVSYGLRNKPATFVGYANGTVAAARAIEQLALNLVEAEAVPLRNTVLIAGVTEAFGADGTPINPVSDRAMRIALDDLAWWSAVLERGRKAGELATSAVRMREMAARA